MATLKEHVYAIQNVINKGPQSDDNRFSNRLIAHYLKNSRALLLKRKLDKMVTLSELSYQTLCVPLEATTYHDCSCIVDEFDCKVLKSTCTLPKDIVGRNKSSIVVRNVLGQKIDSTNISRNDLAAYSISNKATSVGWLIEDGKLVVLNTDLTLPHVLLTAVWEDPEKLDNYCGCSSDDELSPCYNSLDQEFPIDADLVMPMYELTLKFMQITQSYPEDNLNNAKNVETLREKEQ